MRSSILGFLVSVAAACSSQPAPLTDATQLSCPNPGGLPFRMESSGFQKSSNATLVQKDTRVKDEASDTIGNPGGPYASIYLDGSASPTTAPIDYHGIKAVTGSDQGIEQTPITGEWVSAWYYDTGGSDWVSLGRTMTGGDGSYDLPDTSYTAPNGSPVYTMLEANGTCAASYDMLLPAGSKVVVADIDGTLTLSDQEFLTQLSDVTYVPMMMGAANTLMQTWSMKGYPIVYLTARANEFRAETAEWLNQDSFPIGATITGADSNSSDAQAYKTVWMQRMVTDFGWNVVAAYGNMDSDIGAYQAVSIPNSQIFIVGPYGGDLGSTAIPNMDFSSHITSYVDAQPDND
ncbi:MAG TPA: HAD family acid phosphatase [Kofleriaceae bacterium]